MTLLAPLILALSAEAIVDGDCGCPTPAEVGAELDRLLSASSPDVEPGSASFSCDADGVLLKLRRSGSPSRETRLAAKTSCAEQARTIAGVIAVWKLPIPQVALPEPPAAAKATPGERWRLELGTAIQAAEAIDQATDAAPGFLLEAVLRNRGSGWGGRLTLDGLEWMGRSPESGSVGLSRLNVGIGFIQGWAETSLFVDFHEDVLAGVLVATGQGSFGDLRPWRSRGSSRQAEDRATLLAG